VSVRTGEVFQVGGGEVVVVTEQTILNVYSGTVQIVPLIEDDAAWSTDVRVSAATVARCNLITTVPFAALRPQGYYLEHGLMAIILSGISDLLNLPEPKF
jgi:MFS-type transporter involved in bile tolerance (Atg22 family)